MDVTKTHFKKLVCMTPKSEFSMQKAHRTKWHMFFKQRINPNHHIQLILTPFFGESIPVNSCRTVPMVHTINLWITAQEKELSNWLITNISYFSRSELAWLLFVLYVRLYFQKVQDMLRRRGKNLRTPLQIKEMNWRRQAHWIPCGLRCSKL